MTLKDIAREANLSATTVSQVLNGRRLNHASPESRRRVLEIARKLNYRPNLSARQLVTRKNNIIGLLIDTMSPLSFRNILTELERLAWERGFRLQVGVVHENLPAIKHYIDDFHGSGVENVICAAHTYPEFGHEIPELLEGFKRLVYLERPMAESSFPYVASDHFQNNFSAVSTMLKYGYRRIYCLRYNYADHSFTASREGMKKAYMEMDVPWNDCFWRSSDWRKYGDEYFGMLLREIMLESPQVIIVDSDREMLMAMRILRSMGMLVPEDVCLFSAENGPYAKDMTPTLAGFESRPAVVARKIFACLEKQEDGGGNIQPELVTAVPFWGESCPI